MSITSQTMFKKKKKKGKSKNRGVKRKMNAQDEPTDAGAGESRSAGADGGDEEDLAVDVIALQRSRSRRRGNGINTSKLLKPRKDAWAEADAAAAAEAEKQKQQEQIKEVKVGLQTNDAFNARGGMVTSSAEDAEASAKEAELNRLMDAFVNRELQKVKTSVTGAQKVTGAGDTGVDGGKGSVVTASAPGAGASSPTTLNERPGTSDRSGGATAEDDGTSGRCRAKRESKSSSK